jgi:hypothetical protein
VSIEDVHWLRFMLLTLLTPDFIGLHGFHHFTEKDGAHCSMDSILKVHTNYTDRLYCNIILPLDI